MQSERASLLPRKSVALCAELLIVRMFFQNSVVVANRLGIVMLSLRNIRQCLMEIQISVGQLHAMREVPFGAGQIAFSGEDQACYQQGVHIVRSLFEAAQHEAFGLFALALANQHAGIAGLQIGVIGRYFQAALIEFAGAAGLSGPFERMSEEEDVVRILRITLQAALLGGNSILLFSLLLIRSAKPRTRGRGIRGAVQIQLPVFRLVFVAAQMVVNLRRHFQIDVIAGILLVQTENTWQGLLVLTLAEE